MSQKKILVKEICHKSSITSQFEGIINTPGPIREIFEIRHEIENPRVFIGRKIISLLGVIKVKVFYIKNEGHELGFLEHGFNYRNTISGDFEFHHLKPCISSKCEVQDILIESIKSDAICIAGLIQTELVFSIEKEYDLPLIWGGKNYPHNKSNEELKTDQRTERNDLSPEDKERFSQNKDRSSEPLESSSPEINEEEIYAEVINGTNQDFTIILD